MSTPQDHKKRLKDIHRIDQNGQCSISGEYLSYINSKTDLSKYIKREKGGWTTKGNTALVDPVAHMKENGNYRDREQAHHDLKILVDAREQWNKFKVSGNNRLTAMDRGTDDLDLDTIASIGFIQEFIDQKVKEKTKEIEDTIKAMEDVEPVIMAAKNVKGVGYITLAYCLVYIDPEIADTASKLWSYAGLHTPSHKRYKKSDRGKYECGCKPLRTALYTMAESQMKNRQSAYRPTFDAVKERLAQSEAITYSRHPGKSEPVANAWKDAPKGHRNGAALRSVMKHFLADYLYTARKVRGLEMRPVYAQEYLGHTGIVHPSERGWDIE